MKNIFWKLKRVFRARSLGELRHVFFFDVEGLQIEMQLLATSIIGQTVLLFVRPPIVDDAAGQAYRNSSGVMCIDIHPYFAVDDLSFYRVWLHEVGHLYLGHIPENSKRIAEVEKLHMAGRSLTRSEKTKADYKNDPKEKQADSFCEQIDLIVTQKALDLFGNKEIKTRLLVLKKYNFQKNEEN